MQPGGGLTMADANDTARELAYLRGYWHSTLPMLRQMRLLLAVIAVSLVVIAIVFTSGTRLETIESASSSRRASAALMPKIEGQFSQLVGDDTIYQSGLMLVAEDGFEPPTHGL